MNVQEALEFSAREPWHQRCTIRRLSWPLGHDSKSSRMSRKSLKRQVSLPMLTEPYIVTLPLDWNSEMARRLELEALRDGMGNATCNPTQAGSKRRGKFQMTLREYMNEWLPREISRNAEDNIYIFGEFGDQWEPLRAVYKIPPCVACSRKSVAITIGLGGEHSGAPWHFHNAAFVEVFHGAKHFAMLPPGDLAIQDIDEVMQFDASLSQYHWHLEERPRLEQMGKLAALQECTVRPGELLYFPDGWHHGVVNFGPYTAFVSSFINTQAHSEQEDQDVTRRLLLPMV